MTYMYSTIFSVTRFFFLHPSGIIIILNKTYSSKDTFLLVDYVKVQDAPSGLAAAM